MIPRKLYPPVNEVVLGVYVDSGGYADYFRCYWTGEEWFAFDPYHNQEYEISAPDHWRA